MSDIIRVILDSTVRIAIINLLKTYIKSQNDKISKSKNILFRVSPANFKDIYIPLTIQHLNYRTSFDFPKNDFEIYKNIIILGDAGSGKSTFLKHIFLKCEETGYKIPIHFEVRKYDSNFSTLENTLAREISPEYYDKVIELFYKGSFVFIFDGFDELRPEEATRFIFELQKFIDRCVNSNFVLSSRFTASLEYLPKFYNFKILPLNQNEIQIFINRLNLEKSYKNNLLESVSNNKNIGISLGNPLILSIYILMFSYNSNLPFKKSIFYKRVLDAMFSEHDAISKIGYVRPRMSGLGQEPLEKILYLLGFRGFFLNKYSYTKKELVNELELIRKYETFSFEPEKVFYDLTFTLNLLVQNDDNFSFFHLSFVEFLAAMYIRFLPLESKKITFEKLQNSIYINKNFLEIYSELDRENLLKFYIVPMLEIEKKEIKLKEVNIYFFYNIIYALDFLNVLNESDVQSEEFFAAKLLYDKDEKHKNILSNTLQKAKEELNQIEEQNKKVIKLFSEM